jgi:anti-sigma factor RsiW
MMRCEEYQTWFAEYLARALPAPQRRELEDHLAICSACRQDLEAERRLDQLLAAQPLAQPPPDFTLQVLARLQRERAPAPGLGRWLLNGLPYAASAAALLAGLNRVFGALPARARGVLEPSLWDRAQRWVLEGYASLDTGQASALLSPGLLPQVSPLAAFSVLALLTLALYLSLAEEH